MSYNCKIDIVRQNFVKHDRNSGHDGPLCTLENGGQLVGRSSIRLNYFGKNLNSAKKLEHVACGRGAWELLG